MQKLSLCLILCCCSLLHGLKAYAQQHNDREVEVVGSAAMQLDANLIILLVKPCTGNMVNTDAATAAVYAAQFAAAQAAAPPPPLVVPADSESVRINKRKLRKLEQEEAKQVLAHQKRQAFEDSVIASLISKYAMIIGAGNNLAMRDKGEEYYIEFDNFVNYKAFMNALAEINANDAVARVKVFAARSTSYNDSLLHQLKLMALRDAKDKATAFATQQNTSIDRVLKIFPSRTAYPTVEKVLSEAKSASWLQTMFLYEELASDLAKEDSKRRIMDDQGRITYTAECAVIFLLK
jgi:hypothetical protein